MNVRRLRYFLRIAELGSMNRASEALHIAQPALSRQMHMLEKELGAALFTRTPRGIQLTKKGEQLRTEIIGPLRQLDFAFHNAALSYGELDGAVSVGMPPSIVYALALPLMRRIAAAEPRIKMHVVEGNVDHLIEWLVAGKVDLALLYGSSPNDRITERGMVMEDLMLVGPASSGLSPDKPIDFKRLSKYPLILPGTGHGIMAILDKISYITKVSLTISHRQDCFQLTKDLVIAGEGYTVLPYSAFIREYESGTLRYTGINNPVLTRQIVTAATGECRVPRIISRLDVLIQEEISALSQAGRWPGKLLVNPNT